MTLIIVHHHLRPGGIRRVVELATPHLVRESPFPLTRILIATGQRADRRWHRRFVQSLGGVTVQLLIEPSFNYFSEQRSSLQRVTAQIRRALSGLFARTEGDKCLVWAHNLGLGRNLLLTRELAAACALRSIPLVSHHHDWWFDNRWARWGEMRACGFRTLAAAARAIFPPSGLVLHTAINQSDANTLSRHFGSQALWLPNLTEPQPPPTTVRVRAARRWLRNKLAYAEAPVWLLPCRTLRRKNIAEALLLTRWLRPEAWLVVTGAASSKDEIPYFRALERAAEEHHLPLRLGVLVGDESRQPDVPELLAASEAVLLTSIQEGFGLAYLEAAAANRPLIARRLPNIAPDLSRFGFRFPQAYDEILIAPGLFDWRAERARQERLFSEWCSTMPAFARARVFKPLTLTARNTRPVAFSRLTLTAQLEVLAHPARQSWEACAPLNPFLEPWRRRARTAKLRATPWPRTAKQWLGGKTYAQRFFKALISKRNSHKPAFSPEKAQADFIASRLGVSNLYSLLWSTRT